MTTLEGRHTSETPKHGDPPFGHGLKCAHVTRTPPATTLASRAARTKHSNAATTPIPRGPIPASLVQGARPPIGGHETVTALWTSADTPRLGQHPPMSLERVTLGIGDSGLSSGRGFTGSAGELSANLLHINAWTIAVLVLAPAFGLGGWVVFACARSRPLARTSIIALGILIEIYVLIALVLAGAPIVIVGPIWAIAVYLLNIGLPEFRRRATSRPR
jgi:hypothetical protein